MDHKEFVASLPDDLRAALTVPSDAAGVRHLAGHAAAIAVCGGAIAAGVPGWWLLLPVQGVLLVFLFTLEHECTHRTPFAKLWLNEWVGRACGMVLVIITRHIDLSVGSLLGFAAMVMGITQVWVLPQWLGLGHPAIWIIASIVGMSVGASIGAFHGWLVAYRGILLGHQRSMQPFAFASARAAATDGSPCSADSPGALVRLPRVCPTRRFCSARLPCAS